MGVGGLRDGNFHVDGVLGSRRRLLGGRGQGECISGSRVGTPPPSAPSKKWHEDFERQSPPPNWATQRLPLCPLALTFSRYARRERGRIPAKPPDDFGLPVSLLLAPARLNYVELANNLRRPANSGPGHMHTHNTSPVGISWQARYPSRMLGGRRPAGNQMSTDPAALPGATCYILHCVHYP